FSHPGTSRSPKEPNVRPIYTPTRPAGGFTNNFAERQIRPAVILRKNSQSNRSNRGAVTQAVLMSSYRTLRLRGHDPLQTITAALRTYLQPGHLPPLPAPGTANG
ncbi:MAG: transposase, partial [Planctomycetes bacterium]|nr:transposase [Planctomycetota bacterium]